MSGIGVQVIGHGRCGGYGFRGSGRGSRYYTATLNIHKCLCSAFGKKTINYRQKGA